MLKPALPVALCLLLAGCSWPPGPPPGPPEPEPDCRTEGCPDGYVCAETASGWSCVLEDPWDDECDEALEVADGKFCHFEPPQTCSTPEQPCVHNPTSDPRHCELAPPCEPEPPEPVPAECMIESALVKVDGCSSKMTEVVREAALAVGDHTGEPCQETLDLLAGKITGQTGRCAIGGQEAVFVDRWDGLVEENHTCYFGDGSYINGGAGKFIACHAHTKCPDPDPTAYPGTFVLHCGQGNGTVCDSTYKITDRSYCEEVGFTGRSKCPVRLDGNFAREACEEYAVGAQQWWCDGQPVEPFDNRAKARCVGLVKTCTEDGRVCSEADTP